MRSPIFAANESKFVEEKSFNNLYSDIVHVDGEDYIRYDVSFDDFSFIH